jgi:hypothetical protein
MLGLYCPLEEYVGVIKQNLTKHFLRRAVNTDLTINQIIFNFRRDQNVIHLYHSDCIWIFPHNRGIRATVKSLRNR